MKRTSNHFQARENGFAAAATRAQHQAQFAAYMAANPDLQKEFELRKLIHKVEHSAQWKAYAKSPVHIMCWLQVHNGEIVIHGKDKHGWENLSLGTDYETVIRNLEGYLGNG